MECQKLKFRRRAGRWGPRATRSNRERASSRTAIGPMIANDILFDGRWLVAGARNVPTATGSAPIEFRIRVMF